LFISGKEVKIHSPIEAKRHGIALLTEDRRSTGIFPVLSVEDNALISGIDNYTKFNFVVDGKRGKSDVKKHIDMLQVKTPSLKTLIQFLSGGINKK